MREYRTRNRLALQTYRQEDKRLEQVIRACLIEIGQNREGTIWTDPMLGERLKSTQAKASITGFWRMKKAYERNGFTRTDVLYGATGHFACNTLYPKDLK